jgi:hypothetical protein
MKGDFTRFTDRPERGYDAVLMQQGRVTLDADFNEHVDIARRRLATQTIDTIGRACAPVDAPGFGLRLTPDGQDIVIGTGRMYVEGLLVELLPGSTITAEVVDELTLQVADADPDGRPWAEGQWAEVDASGGPVLVRIDAVDGDGRLLTLGSVGGVDGFERGVRLRRVTTYRTQPWWPAEGPAPLGEPLDPEAWADLRTLVYLEVWERHVTAVEDPALLEPALGGPDTATRIQIAWAVRVLQSANGPVDLRERGCGDDVEVWDALTAPAAGRLSARAEAPADPLKPCDVPPNAGYQGLENRLYRVEIHEPGPLGTATFLWSRDNGTVLTGIRSFVAGTPFRVEVERIGRDRELRFGAGDTVAVESDDTTAAGAPSALSQVQGQPDHARRLVPLADDVSTFDAHRRPRLRRWDAPGQPTASGWTELEDGVQVRFSGGPFRTGDWWVVAARTATGDVEGFVEAPPRGIARHRTRLGIIAWGDGSVEDCRSTFPTLCSHRDHDGGRGCCSITVSPTGDASGDVDSLAGAVALAAQVDGPVRICLLPGRHTVTEVVRVDRSQVTISGCGARSPVAADQGGVLAIGHVSDIRLDHLHLRSADEAPTVLAAGTSHLEVEDCSISNGRRRGGPRRHPLDHIEDDRGAGPALSVVGGRFVELDDLELEGAPAAVLSGNVVVLSDSLAIGGVVVAQGSRGVEVRDNVIGRAPFAGVQLGLLDRAFVERLGRASTTAVPPWLEWLARLPSTSLLDGLDGLELGDTAIEAVEIVGNTIGDNGVAGVGTPPAGATELRGVLIADDRIQGNGGALTERFAIGAGVLLVGADDVRIRGCWIEDNAGRVADGLSVSGGVVVGDSHGLVVSDSTLRDNHPPEGQELTSFAVGVAGLMVSGGDPETDGPSLLGGAAAVVSDNEIRNAHGPGVVVIGAGPVTVSDNRIVTRYLGGTLDLAFGRAVVVVDLAAGPDARLTHRATTTALVHGPVQFHDNHVVVQSGGRLPPIEVDTGISGADARLLTGSAVVLFSGDDISIQGNQVANTVHGVWGTGIGASIWALASTVRAVGNRVTEIPGSALFSYAGTGQLAHVTSANIVTHCMTATGARVQRTADIEMSCRPELERFELFVPLHTLIV